MTVASDLAIVIVGARQAPTQSGQPLELPMPSSWFKAFMLEKAGIAWTSQHLSTLTVSQPKSRFRLSQTG
jgi:hypothetical protein